MNTLVVQQKQIVQQKPIVETSYTEFYISLANALHDGWLIVPGTVAISLVFDSNRNNVVERYVAVLQK